MTRESATITNESIGAPKPWLKASVIVLALTVLAACGAKDEKKAAGQAVARVNKEELTVHQINFLLGQQRGMRPEQTDAASRQILERLIEQELAIQKAGAQKLDRDARVLQQLEAAKREILSRAYFDRVGDAAPKPSEADIKKYYEANTALFAQRRVYQLQEINIEAKADKIESLREALKTAKSAADFVNYLRSNNYKFAGNQVVRGAEQIPLNMLPNMSKMKDGDSVFNPSPTGATVLVLVGSRLQAVDEATARPAIEQFLTNERKRALIAEDIKSLRAAADIKYLGKFADTPKDGAAPAAALPADSAGSAGTGFPPSSKSAEPPAGAASAALDAKSISKGLGLK
jgi:EpsD family peptidyl-prolyl cis-trans isomerase